MPRRLRKGIALATGLALSFLVTVAGAEIIDRVLAIVNGALVTQTDVYGAMAFGVVDREDDGPGPAAADPIAAALDRLIERALVLVEVNRYAPPEPPEADLAAGVEAVRARFASAEAYQRALAATGYSEDRVRGAVRDDLRIRTYLEQRFGSTLAPADRAAMIAEWKAGLRRRADITIQYQPVRPVLRTGPRAARSPSR
jgi:hypothetical protein